MELVQTCEAGKYFRHNGKTFFLSNQDMEIDFLVKSLRFKLEEEWPTKWEEIKTSIPKGPFPFIPSQNTRKDELIEDLADIFLLTRADFLRLGLGDDHVDTLITNIGKSKSTPFHKVLFGLGIRHIGRENAKLLADKFGSPIALGGRTYAGLDRLGRATWTEVILIPGIGATTGTSILEYFHLEDSWRNIEKLRLAGIDYAFGYQSPKEEQMTTSFDNLDKQSKLADNLTGNFYPQLYEKAEELGVTVIQIHDTLEFGGLLENQNRLFSWMKDTIDSILQQKASPIKGKTFMFTGRLECYTRHQAQEKVESLGGIAGSSVTSSTDYLVVGENPGSKLGKAVALGVKRISEEEFSNFLKE